MHHFQSKQKILVDHFWQKFDIFSMLYKIDSTMFILRDIIVIIVRDTDNCYLKKMLTLKTVADWMTCNISFSVFLPPVMRSRILLRFVVSVFPVFVWMWKFRHAGLAHRIDLEFSLGSFSWYTTMVGTGLIDLSQYNNLYNNHFMAIIQINLCLPSPPVKNWRILLVHSFTACMPLITNLNTM